MWKIKEIKQKAKRTLKKEYMDTNNIRPFYDKYSWRIFSK